jgi:hypothetical protein
MNVAQSIGGIEPLLDSFMGFLRRKTDFFSGAASEGAAQEQVLKAFAKNKARADEDSRERAAKEKKRKAEEEKRRERIEAEKLAKQQVRASVCWPRLRVSACDAARSCARAQACGPQRRSPLRPSLLIPRPAPTERSHPRCPLFLPLLDAPEEGLGIQD